MLTLKHRVGEILQVQTFFSKIAFVTTLDMTFSNLNRNDAIFHKLVGSGPCPKVTKINVGLDPKNVSIQTHAKISIRAPVSFFIKFIYEYLYPAETASNSVSTIDVRMWPLPITATNSVISWLLLNILCSWYFLLNDMKCFRLLMVIQNIMHEIHL